MTTVIDSLLPELNSIIWGKGVIENDIFERWCQGFCFSPAEPTALVQDGGGPCAVLAAVQAVILREILFARKQQFSELTGIFHHSPSSHRAETDGMELLVSALLSIMLLTDGEKNRKCWYWAHWTPADASSAVDRECERFFRGLKLIDVSSVDELHGVIMSLAPELQSKYGVLCFLYSILFNYGMESLRSGMADDAETLIDPIYGHASQCLINLLISGQATPYLFDGQRNVSGIPLTGILKQPHIGFLTLFEALHYCESGWYLKNPSFPIWILGSETHFTVLASPNSSLVCEETTSEPKGATLHQAELEFSRMSADQDTKSGFIQESQLEDLLKRLQISFTTNSLGNLKKLLDPEDLGIILESSFLQHFFPQEIAKRRTVVREFRVIHYNGLEKSNSEGHVRYQMGEARILDPTEDLVALEEIERSPIQRCLQTKWPTISLKWDDGRTPSLN